MVSKDLTLLPRQPKNLSIKLLPCRHTRYVPVDFLSPAPRRAKTQVVQNFIQPTQQSVRQERIQELRKVIDLLDIQPLYHPIRTMITGYAIRNADKIRARLDEDQPEVTVGTAPIWRLIWDNLQPTSIAMWASDTGCGVSGRKYIRHMLASKRLADRLEEGGQVDNSMYSEILR